MHKVAFALVYLACVGHGRRVQISIDQLQSSLDVDDQNAFGNLASLLLESDSAAAFNTAGSLTGRQRRAVPETAVVGRAPLRMQAGDDDMTVSVKKAAPQPAPAPVPAPEPPPAPPSVADAAQTSIDSILSMLDEGVEPPKSMLALKEALTGGDAMATGAALYNVLIEQTLDYDLTVERKMVPTTLDYSKTDDPKVKEKIGYVYTYGINMLKRNLISEDAVKDIVTGKICSRVGMDGAEMDQWLQIPAVI